MCAGAPGQISIMYGAKAFLIFLGFLIVASAFLVGVFDLWKHSHRQKERLGLGGIVLTAFLLLWVFLISSGYIRKVHFHYELWRLSASDVTSIQIGRHDFSISRPLRISLERSAGIGGSR